MCLLYDKSNICTGTSIAKFYFYFKIYSIVNKFWLKPDWKPIFNANGLKPVPIDNHFKHLYFINISALQFLLFPAVFGLL
jgi:hypothetical protein